MSMLARVVSSMSFETAMREQITQVVPFSNASSIPNVLQMPTSALPPNKSSLPSPITDQQLYIASAMFFSISSFVAAGSLFILLLSSPMN